MLISLTIEISSNFASVKSMVPYEAVSPWFSLFCNVKHSSAKFAAVADVSAAGLEASPSRDTVSISRWGQVQPRRIEVPNVVCAHCLSTLHDFNHRCNCVSFCKNFIRHHPELPTFFLVTIQKSHECKHCWLSHLPVLIYFFRKRDPVSSSFREEEKDFKDLGPEWET